jgi:hypothetical protein
VYIACWFKFCQPKNMDATTRRIAAVWEFVVHFL